MINKRLLTILMVAVTLGTLAAACKAVASNYEEKLLTSFDKNTSGWKVTSGASGGHSTERGGTLRVQMTGEKGGGFKFTQTQDLSGWDKLKIDVFCTGKETIVTLKARDAQGTSYISWYQRIAPGANILEYNLRGFASSVADRGRVSTLDMTKIAALSIHLEGKSPGTIYHVDNIRLSRGVEPFVPPQQTSGTQIVEKIVGNLVSNSDFELGLQNWNSWGQWDGGSYSFGTGKNENARTGLASAAIHCKKKGRGGIFTDLEIKTAGTYQFRFFVKGDVAKKMRFSVEGKNGGGFTEDIPVTSDWTVVEKSWQAHAGSGQLYLYHIGEGDLFIDSVSLVLQGGEQQALVAAHGERPSVVKTMGDKTTVNGKPFFPIGIYGVQDPVVELAGTGMNFAIGGATDASEAAWMSKCHQAGVMTIAGLTGLLRGHMGAQSGSVPEAFKDRAAFFGYYLCDEPDHGRWNVTPQEIRQAHHILRQEDPDHPSIVLVMGWDRSMAYQYADTADIIAADPYSVTDMDKPVRQTLWMEDGQASQQPVWTVLQAGWDKTPPLSLEALECQAYASIASGADAIFWFELQWCKRYPEQWEKIKAISLELKEIHDELCGSEPEAMQPKFSDPRIIGITKQTDQGLLFITVNKTMEKVGAVTMSVPNLGDEKLIECFSDGKASMKQGTLTATYGPGQRRVYRLRESRHGEPIQF